MTVRVFQRELDEETMSRAEYTYYGIVKISTFQEEEHTYVRLINKNSKVFSYGTSLFDIETFSV